MGMCPCETIITITCVCTLFVLYHFTSVFALTVTIGFVALCLYLYINDDHKCSDCLTCGLICVCIVVVILIIAVSALATLIQYGYNSTYCHFNECCDDNLITSNIGGLSLQLNKNLYGQHLVIGPIVKHLRGHVEGQPQKATVLALHGMSGTGKNFVSGMVAENMYVNGMQSKYVHLLSGTKDFPQESLLEEYKETLKLKIETAGKECKRSLIIIDETDKLPPGLIDTISPYVDYYDYVNENVFKKFVFLLLSNSGGDKIAERVVSHYVKGHDRRSLEMKTMEEIVRTSSLNEPNGLVNSSIIKQNLITAYIPFLPLERKHVEKCIIDGLFAKGFYAFDYQVDYEVVKSIADEMMYFPDSMKFSTTGCKRVMEKIDFIIQS